MRIRHLIAAMILSAAVAAGMPGLALAETEQGAGEEASRSEEQETSQEASRSEEQGSGQEVGRSEEQETGPEASRSEKPESGQAAEAWAEGQQTSQPGEKPGAETVCSQLIMLSGAEKAQMLSVIIRSENGGLVVIDGGWEADGERLLETIKQYGGRVDAWLLTHPHADHVGALYYILKDRSGEITIDNIYCSLAESEWYWEVSPQDGPVVDALKYELSRLPEGVVHDTVGNDFEKDVDNLHITALNNRYELSYDPVNNSTIVYMVDTSGEKLLFLGDMGYGGGQFLLKEAGDRLKADIVQMAHHGQNGVDKKVYMAVAPRICLWPTPQWLWDNDNGDGYDSGAWRTLETRQWIEELGVERNYVVKDGDIMLLLN